jgi:hypothetical protein
MCAATYLSAVGPSHTGADALKTVVNSVAAESYRVLSDAQVAAAASNGPGPGPLLSSVECTSGGRAIHTGAVIRQPAPK